MSGLCVPERDSLIFDINPAQLEQFTNPRVLAPYNYAITRSSQEVLRTARKRYSDEDALKVLREIDVHLHEGLDVVSSCRKAGISDKTYYYWRKKFGGMGRSQLSEMRALRKENERLKKILTELQLDKLILKESLDYLKPKA